MAFDCEGEIPEMIETVVINVVYGVLGLLIGLLAMKAGYYFLDSATPFNTSTELKNGNLAVGVAVAGIFIGLGLCIGLLVGLSLN